jgi:hypothetical protein
VMFGVSYACPADIEAERKESETVRCQGSFTWEPVKHVSATGNGERSRPEMDLFF